MIRRGDIVALKRVREVVVWSAPGSAWATAQGLSRGGYRPVMRAYWNLARAARVNRVGVVVSVLYQGWFGAADVTDDVVVFALDASLQEPARKIFGTLIASDEWASDTDLHAEIIRSSRPRAKKPERKTHFRWGVD